MIYNALIFFIAIAMSMTFFGKSIVGIGLGCAVIVSGILLFQNRPTVQSVKSFFTTREMIAIMAMMVAWMVAANIGLNPSKSLKETAEISGLILGGMIIFAGLQTQDFPFPRFFKIITLGASFCALYLTLTPWLGDYAVGWGSSYGSVLAIISPMALWCAMHAKGRKILWWICLAVIMAGVFASGGRTAWISLLTIMVMALVFMPRKEIVTRAILIGVITFSAFVGLKSYEAHVGEDVFEVRTAAMTNSYRPMSGRLTVWQDTITHIQNHNPFFGVGIKGSHELEISKGYGAFVRHVHNAPLEITLETGLIGLVLFSVIILIFVARFLKAYFRSKDNALKPQALTIFLSCIAFGVAAMSLTSIFYTWWFLYLVVLVVMLKTATLQLKK